MSELERDVMAMRAARTAVEGLMAEWAATIAAIAVGTYLEEVSEQEHKRSAKAMSLIEADGIDDDDAPSPFRVSDKGTMGAPFDEPLDLPSVPVTFYGTDDHYEIVISLDGFVERVLRSIGRLTPTGKTSKPCSCEKCV